MTPAPLTILGRTLRGPVDEATMQHLRTQWVESVAPVAPPSQAIVVEIQRECTPPHTHGRAIPGAFGPSYRPIAPDTFWVLDASTAGGVLVDLTEATPRMCLAGEPFTAFTALDAALSEVLAATGVVRLHAAVVTRGPVTLALLGPSGRGKSTTAYRAAIAGWQVVTEDDCFVDQDTLAVHGVGHTVNLRADAVDRLGKAVAGIDPTASTVGRHSVPFAAIGGRADTAVLTHLVHLTADRGSRPTWTPMTPSDAVMALHESCGIPMTDRVGRLHAAWFPAVVRRTTLLRLDPGPANSPFPEVAP